MGRIPIFTYGRGDESVFNDGKKRPGFEIKRKLFVLTHKEPPVLRPYVAIEGSRVTDHFKTNKQVVFVVRAPNRIEKYNNSHGGFLELSLEEAVSLGITQEEFVEYFYIF